MNPTEAVAEAPVEAADNPDTDTLSAVDRCDKCGSQAYVSVTLSTGDLLFCLHDWKALKDKIEPKALAVTDESWKLYKTTKLDVSA